MGALHEIRADLVALMQRVEDAEGVIDDELGAALDAAAGDFTSKVRAYLAKIRTWEGEITAADDAIARATAYRNARKNRIAGLRGYLLEEMRAAGIPKVEAGPLGTAYITPPKRRLVPTARPEELDPRFQRITTAVDKRALGEALDAGEDVPARWDVGEPVLTIR